MPYSSIIFDLDGTLLDTLDCLAETSNSVLSSFGYPGHSREEYRFFVGDGLTTLMERITPQETSGTVITECCDLFNHIYSENWKQNCVPYDGILEMLVALRENHINLAILSNKPHIFTKTIVDYYFPGEVFPLVYGQRDGFAKKPDPSVALAIAEQLGSLPRETVFVGDSGVDIRTGKSAGMFTVGVTWGFRGVFELKENHADLLINSPEELLHYVVRSI